tara:strand:- start:1223 stop:1969 length:747 start_codon:yes stop_codon:yes gene_type:complete
MAKKSGLGQNLYIGGYDLSGDIGVINNAASPRVLLPITAINKSAMERINGPADGLIDFNAFFNDAALAAHAALSGLPATDVNVLWAIGTAVDDPAKMLVAKQVGYDPSRGADGSLLINVQAMVNGVAPEWGEMLSAGQITHASATSSASRDDTAATAAGAAAMLHIFDIDSGTPTVVIEDSPNDSAWSTLISFTAVADGAEPASERKTVATAATTPDRYLRLTTTGTFTNCDFAVAIRRGEAVDDTAY